jgi:hypothetical protein
MRNNSVARSMQKTNTLAKDHGHFAILHGTFPIKSILKFIFLLLYIMHNYCTSRPRRKFKEYFIQAVHYVFCF